MVLHREVGMARKGLNGEGAPRLDGFLVFFSELGVV